MNETQSLTRPDSRTRVRPVSGHEPHERWLTAITALRDAGVAPELDLEMLVQIIGGCVARPPEPFAMAELLTRYFHEDGHPFFGLERRRTARYLVHHEGDSVTAHKLVVRIGLAARELDRLTLVDDAATRSLALCSGETWTPLESEDLFLDMFNIDDRTYSRRVVTVRGLVAATNRVLSQRNLHFRFVPIMMPENLEAFVGVSARAVGILDAAGLLEIFGNELSHFTCWSTAAFGCSYLSVV